MLALVLEGMPRELARIVTEELTIPTICIAQGPRDLATDRFW